MYRKYKIVVFYSICDDNNESYVGKCVSIYRTVCVESLFFLLFSATEAKKSTAQLHTSYNRIFFFYNSKNDENITSMFIFCYLSNKN